MVDDGRTDGRTPDHGHPISSPCEPNGSGELKSHAKTSEFPVLPERHTIGLILIISSSALKWSLLAPPRR